MPARAEAVRALQRQIGNRATARLLGASHELAESQPIDNNRGSISRMGRGTVARSSQPSSPDPDIAAPRRTDRSQPAMEHVAPLPQDTLAPAQRKPTVVQRVDAAGQLVLDDAGFTTADLAVQAQAIDRGALTKAGRAAAKHSVRVGSAFGPELKGNDGVKNAAGLAHVNEILNSGASTVVKHAAGRFGEVLDIQIPGGKGVRFAIDGTMIGFLEP